MRGFVAPTDYGWYQFLRARPELREVNFWRPSQNRFGALDPGELFFFKLKAPHNAIGGFGLFTRGAVLPAWEAWDVFGPANGTADLAELLARIERLAGGSARGPMNVDTWIGCLAINEPVFFPPDEWVDVPADWRREIVSGKGYDLSSGHGRLLYERCIATAAALDAGSTTDEAAIAARYGPAQLVKPRLGQASFRIAVLDAYSKRCAITGERSLPVVEAAHIKPFAAGGAHAVENGLPLRRDLHRLFDLGYVSLRPDHSLAVSKALHEQFENGRVYYDLEGAMLRPPADPDDRPDRAALEWHYEEVFRR
ncbi:MAG: HNH endonuclease [Acidobacteria bacterium]|nr:MAG: HNH endonuclease [Acidobacteriota bacterium]